MGRSESRTRRTTCADEARRHEDPEAPPANGTTEHQSLSKYIQARFDECSRSQKDVAQYIVDHLDEAAFQTAEELARRANTSSSTVVRFSQALGFEGFPELQAAAREEYRRVNAGRRGGRAGSSTPLFSLDQNEFESALAADHLNVEETARKVSRSAVEALIAAIVEAEKVLVAGTDQMAFFASYLRHLLMLLDLRVDVVASPSQEALSRLGRIDDDTLVIGLSAGRPHPLVVRAMKLARHRKARTDGDHRRDALRGREARPDQALLLLEQPRLRALAHGAAEHDPGARLRRLLAGHRAVRRPHQGLPAEVSSALSRRLAAASRRASRRLTAPLDRTRAGAGGGLRPADRRLPRSR